MPTGYTCHVVDGKITEFPEFALSCWQRLQNIAATAASALTSRHQLGEK